MFRDRIDAANRLSEKLKQYDLNNAVILAIPRGGVEVGYVLSKNLQLPLDVLLIKKIGHPLNKELAIGAISQYGRTMDEKYDVSKDYIETESAIIEELLQKRAREYGRENSLNLRNKTVIITDDGIATGHTMFAAIDVVKAHQPSQIIIAVPVASPRTIHILKQEADVVICEICPEDFFAVGQFYQTFSQLTDEEAIEYLRKNISKLKKFEQKDVLPLMNLPMVLRKESLKDLW